MLPGSRPGAVSILFNSPAHQHRVFTVVCAIEGRQQLPAFRREPLNVGVSDVAKYFSEYPMVQSLCWVRVPALR